jgi:hypothetical protein
MNEKINNGILPPPGLPPRPRREDFQDEYGYEDREAYLEAVADWKVECKFIKDDHNQEVNRINKENADFVSSVAKKYPDFPKLLEATPITPLMRDALLSADHGVELAHYLSMNPQEADRISRMGPLEAAAAMGKLDLKVAPRPNPAPQDKVEKAPPSLDDIEDDEEYFRQGEGTTLLNKPSKFKNVVGP